MSDFKYFICHVFCPRWFFYWYLKQTTTHFWSSSLILLIGRAIASIQKIREVLYEHKPNLIYALWCYCAYLYVYHKHFIFVADKLIDTQYKISLYLPIKKLFLFLLLFCLLFLLFFVLFLNKWKSIKKSHKFNMIFN